MLLLSCNVFWQPMPPSAEEDAIYTSSAPDNMGSGDDVELQPLPEPQGGWAEAVQNHRAAIERALRLSAQEQEGSESDAAAQIAAANEEASNIQPATSSLASGTASTSMIEQEQEQGGASTSTSARAPLRSAAVEDSDAGS